MSDIHGAMFHESVGTGAGAALGPDGRNVPVVTMYFLKESTLERVNNGEAFDEEDDDNFNIYALSIRGARQLLGDLKDAIDAAIAGPGVGEAN